MTDFSSLPILSELHDWILAHADKGAVAVVCGRNGDMDTVGAAVSIASIHPHLMACGLHMNKLSQRLVTDLEAPFRILSEQNTQWPSSLSAIIVVDAAAENQTGLSLPNVPICVIDHHATNDWVLDDEDFLCQLDARSTTQIVYEFLHRYVPDALTEPVCKLLVAGLITDTGRFKFADSSVFSSMAGLSERSNIDLQAFIEYIEQDDLTLSDQGVLLRGLHRAKIEQAGQWRLVLTRAGTQEGKLAQMLRGLQTDVVLITRHRYGETRLTARASRHAVLQGVHLGSIMSKVAERIGGDGGGHHGAAGWSGKCDGIAAETAFLDVLARTKQEMVK